MKNLLLALALLTSIGSMAQTEVNNFSPGKNIEGVTYYLPSTQICIKATAIHEIYTPGEFSKYAEKYLRLKGISTEASNIWKLQEVEVSAIGSPNPDKMYSIKIKDRTSAPLVTLTQDGILWGINIQPEKTREKLVSQPTPNKKYNSREFLTEEIIMAGSTAKMAELTAQEIYSIRESRNSILRGQAENMPKDGDSMKFMIAQLNTQEAALLQMFTGYTETIVRTKEVKINPSDSIQHQTAFRFSSRLGILNKDNLAGDPIYIDLKPLETMPNTNAEDSKRAKRPNGIVYNIPGKAQVNVYKGRDSYFDGVMNIAQFGSTETLSSDLFNKHMQTRITFDTATGAVRKIDAELPQE